MKVSVLKKELASRVLRENRFGKSMEKELVEGFLRRLQLNSVDIKESESPDFFINLSNGKRIGLEFTLYYSDSKKYGSNGRAVFERWAKIAEKLREKFINHGKGLEYWYGAVHFKNGKWKLMGLDIDKFVDEIYKFCIQNIKQQEKCFNISNFKKCLYLKRFVNHIHFHNTFPEKGILWWHSSLQSGSVPSPINSIRKIIRSKNKTAQKNYKRNNPGCSVLVVCARALSLWDSGVLLKEELIELKNVKNCFFDYIYYWDKFSENIFEVYPRQRIVFDCEEKSLYVSRVPSTFPLK